MNTDTMGVYGNYYLKRAIVAQLGLGANLPEDAIYPLNLGDDDGKPLDGANNYTIHFDKDDIPPAEAFWSITLYDNGRLPGCERDQPLRRVELDAVRIQSPTARSISISRTRARAPTRKRTGCRRRRVRYNLTMRLYAPKIGRADRQMEPAAGHKGRRAAEPAAIE